MGTDGQPDDLAPIQPQHIIRVSRGWNLARPYTPDEMKARSAGLRRAVRPAEVSLIDSHEGWFYGYKAQSEPYV